MFKFRYIPKFEKLPNRIDAGVNCTEWLVGWLLWISCLRISVYIEPSFRQRQNEKKERRAKERSRIEVAKKEKKKE